MTVESRKLMAHSALDTSEVTELKRLWWSLHNTLRVWDFLELSHAMSEVETLIRSLTAS